jgi:hypothetical protein
MPEPAATKDTLREDILRQYKEELGPDTVPVAHDVMLRQKFGLIPVQAEFTGTAWARKVKMMEAINGA